MASSKSKGVLAGGGTDQNDAGGETRSQRSLTIRRRPETTSQGRDAFYRLLYEKEPKFRQLAAADPDFADM